MTYWTPKLQVWLNGSLWAGWASTTDPGTLNVADGVGIIESLNITGGRPDVTVQPDPMQASIDILVDGQITDTQVPLGASMVVKVYNDYTSTWDPLFTGLVSDKTLSLTNWFNGGGLFTYSFHGYSRMASLAIHRQTWNTSTTNAVTAAGFTCSQRIVEVLSNWQYSPTWVGTINSDSIYIHKRAADQYVDNDLIQSAAQTGRGCFHDRADGKVYYNNFANTLPSSPQYISEAHIMADSVSVTRSITDIYNAIHVTTTDASISDSTASSSGTGSSQDKYGYRYGSRDTECDVKTDMNTQASAFLSARANPRWRPSSIRIDLGLIETTELQFLPMYLPVRTNTRWVLPLPSALGGNLDCLVDNWAWTFSRNRMYLDVQLSLVLDTHPS